MRAACIAKETAPILPSRIGNGTVNCSSIFFANISRERKCWENRAVATPALDERTD